jgi:uncharacterized protein YxjI
MPPSGYGPAVRYEITQNKLLEKGLFSIVDDSGTLRFTIPGNWSICDSSGEELAAINWHAFRRQADILRNGQVVASVHVAGLSAGENYSIDSPAGQFAASGDFSGHRYTLTGPGGGTVATVTRQLGFRESFDAEIAPGQDDVLLLAVVLAIEDIRDRRGNPAIT